jgi:hypothetical protein
MREIMFRGQTRRFGEKVRMNGEKVPSNWVYGGICQGKGDFSIIYGSMDDKLEQPTEKHVVYTETVGQYTGLTDKNGKKIFEGDIVSLYTGTRYEVDFDEGRRGWFPFAQGDGCGCCEIDTHHLRHCEVIGNIHDNPELLKGGEV